MYVQLIQKGASTATPVSCRCIYADIHGLLLHVAHWYRKQEGVSTIAVQALCHKLLQKISNSLRNYPARGEGTQGGGHSHHHHGRGLIVTRAFSDSIAFHKIEKISSFGGVITSTVARIGCKDVLSGFPRPRDEATASCREVW